MVRILLLQSAQPNVTSLGTLTSLTVDDISIDGSTISDSGDLTLDIGGDLNIDVDGTDIILKDGGTSFGRFKRDSSNFIIKSETNNKDIVFRGQDGGSTIDALTLDMSEAGTAIFNNNIQTTGNISGSSFSGSLQGDIGGSTTIDVSALSIVETTLGTHRQVNQGGDFQRGVPVGLYHQQKATTLGFTSYYYANTKLTITGSVAASSLVQPGDLMTYTPLTNNASTETVMVLDVTSTTIIVDKEFNIGDTDPPFDGGSNNASSFIIKRPNTVGGLGSDSDGTILKSQAQFNGNVQFDKKVRINDDFLIDNNVTNISSSVIFLNGNEIWGDGKFNMNLIPEWGYVLGSGTPAPTYDQNYVSIGTSTRMWRKIYGDTIYANKIIQDGTGLISSSDQITGMTTYKETVSGASSYAVTHSLNEEYPVVQCWNTSTSQQEFPQSVTTNSANHVTVAFNHNFAGKIIVKK